MKKKMIAGILLALMLFSLCACTQEPVEETTKATRPLDPEIAKKMVPWDYDVRAKAMESGTMEYYFMYYDEIKIERSNGNGYTYKWGDSCLICFPNGETMLIDSGRPEYAAILTLNLKQMGITKLDYVMFSHRDADHVSGALTWGGVFGNFEVGKVFYPAVDTDFDYVKKCAQAGVAEERMQGMIAGDVVNIGDVKMTVLWPTPAHQGKSYSDTTSVNNVSLVVRFDFKEHSSLFTGDIYRSYTTNGVRIHNAENLMVDYYTGLGQVDLLDVDFLKAPHHGGNSSSGDVFLNAVTPWMAVSTGYETVPNTVKNRYKERGCLLMSDRDYGYIHLSADGTGYIANESSMTPEEG